MTALALPQIQGLDITDTGLLLDGRRRVGFVLNDDDGSTVAWVYGYDRRTQVETPKYLGRYVALEAAVQAVVMNRPERSVW